MGTNTSCCILELLFTDIKESIASSLTLKDLIEIWILDYLKTQLMTDHAGCLGP